MNGDQAWHAAPLEIFAANGMAGALGRDHQHVEILAGFDQVEMDIEAMGEEQGRALLEIRGEIVGVDFALQLVRGQHHDDVRPFGGLGHFHHLQSGAFSLGCGGGALAQSHGHVWDAAFLEIEGMGETLASVADNGDFLALDEIDVGIPIVINAHLLCFPRLAAGRPIWRLSDARPWERAMGRLYDARPKGRAMVGEVEICGFFYAASPTRSKARILGSDRLRPSRNRGDAGPGDFHEADRAHQIDEFVDFFWLACQFEDEALRRGVDDAGAKGVGELQRVGPVLAAPAHLDHGQFALQPAPPCGQIGDLTHRNQPLQLMPDLFDRFRSPRSPDRDPREMFGVSDFGHSQALDIVRPSRKQSDDARENAGLIVRQYRKRVRLYLGLRRRRGIWRGR